MLLCFLFFLHSFSVSLVLVFPTQFFCFSSFCFSYFSAFRFSASLLFAFPTVLPVFFLLLFFFRFLLFLLLLLVCFSVFVLLCLFFSSVMCFCCSTFSSSFASALAPFLYCLCVCPFSCSIVSRLCFAGTSSSQCQVLLPVPVFAMPAVTTPQWWMIRPTDQSAKKPHQHGQAEAMPKLHQVGVAERAATL